MRPSQKSNRPRGRGSRKPSGNNVNRVYESSGPEGKVRGTPQQIIEKYLTLARDAQTSGNRVVAENFLQHAEHYQRILVEAMGVRQEQRRDGEQPGIEQPDAEQPEGAETESGAEAAAEGSGAQPGEGASHGEGRRPSRGNGRGNGRREGQDPRDSEVSGLTMIDSGEGDSGSLLVDAEELSASQPRRRRRRDPDQNPEQEKPAAPAEADAQPE